MKTLKTWSRNVLTVYCLSKMRKATNPYQKFQQDSLSNRDLLKNLKKSENFLMMTWSKCSTSLTMTEIMFPKKTRWKLSSKRSLSCCEQHYFHCRDRIKSKPKIICEQSLFQTCSTLEKVEITWWFRFPLNIWLD